MPRRSKKDIIHHRAWKKGSSGARAIARQAIQDMIDNGYDAFEGAPNYEGISKYGIRRIKKHWVKKWVKGHHVKGHWAAKRRKRS